MIIVAKKEIGKKEKKKKSLFTRKGKKDGRAQNILSLSLFRVESI